MTGHMIRTNRRRQIGTAAAAISLRLARRESSRQSEKPNTFFRIRPSLTYRQNESMHLYTHYQTLKLQSPGTWPAIPLQITIFTTIPKLVAHHCKQGRPSTSLRSPYRRGKPGRTSTFCSPQAMQFLNQQGILSVPQRRTPQAPRRSTTISERCMLACNVCHLSKQRQRIPPPRRERKPRSQAPWVIWG